MNALERLGKAVAAACAAVPPTRVEGTVTEVAPGHCRVAGLSRFVELGDRVTLGDGTAEVIRIDDLGVTVKPFETRVTVGIGSTAARLGPFAIAPAMGWRGRVLDALAAPIDGLGPVEAGPRAVPVEAAPPPAMRRALVRTPVRTGVRVIDCFTPLCAGQRIGVFAGSGVGKSTLLAMLARAGGFDTVVIGLVGERGREVRDFLQAIPAAAQAAVVTVVATGDESPMMRRLAPKTAMTIAEFFRDEGHSVLLIVDSITRYAHAAREVALAAGEPAVARGYAPSVFTELPRLLERAGPGAEGGGAITGIFAVLVDGDDHNDPVADAIRGTLDGHVVLERAIADQGRYPAVNVLASVSRLADHVWSADQRTAVQRLRACIARYEDTRDLRLMGGYQPGADPELDQAVALVPKLFAALAQSPASPPSADAFRELAEALHSA